MSPEAAALVGVGIGAILSFVGSMVINERSQAAERTRLEMQFAEYVDTERRKSARKVRLERLQPALELLTALENMIAGHIQKIGIESMRAEAEKEFGPLNDDAWEAASSQLQTVKPAAPTTILGEFYPKIVGIPLPGLETDLKVLLLTAVSVPAISGMDATQRNSFLKKMRSIRNSVDAEIIRGDWP